MEVFDDRGEQMTVWDSRTCTAHPYAEKIAELVEDNVPKESNVLMLGLGGGAIGARLCSKKNNVVVLEKYQDVIDRASSPQTGFFRHFKKCNLNTNMQIVLGDATRPNKLKNLGITFDCIIQDIPPCYLEGNSKPIRACTDFASPKCVLINNFYTKPTMNRVMHELRDIWTEDFATMAQYNHINLARKQWASINRLETLCEKIA